MNRSYKADSNAARGESHLNIFVFSDSLRDEGIVSTEEISITHNIDDTLVDSFQTQSIDIRRPTKLIVKSRALTKEARLARTPAFQAALRRKAAKEILASIEDLEAHQDRYDFSVATYPVLKSIRDAIQQMQSAEREGNSREILRTIRDSLMDGGAMQYKTPENREPAKAALKILSQSEEVDHDDVAEIHDRFAAFHRPPLLMIDGSDVEEQEETEIPD